MLEQMKRDYEGSIPPYAIFLRDADSDSPDPPSASAVSLAELSNVCKNTKRPSRSRSVRRCKISSRPTRRAPGIDRTSARTSATAEIPEAFLLLSGIQSRSLNAREAASANSRGGFGAASELLTFDEQYRPAIENLLGGSLESNSSMRAFASRGKTAIRSAS